MTTNDERCSINTALDTIDTVKRRIENIELLIRWQICGFCGRNLENGEDCPHWNDVGKYNMIIAGTGLDSYNREIKEIKEINEAKAKSTFDGLANTVKKLHDDFMTLRKAICQTLDNNSHLADGEYCTLLPLKQALRKVGKPWSGDEEEGKANDTKTRN